MNQSNATPRSSDSKRLSGRTIAIGVLVLQLAIYAISYFADPGHIGQLVNNTGALWFLLALLVWQIVGLVQLWIKPSATLAQMVLIVVIHSTPLAIAPMCSPMIVAIADSIGTSTTSSDSNTPSAQAASDASDGSEITLGGKITALPVTYQMTRAVIKQSPDSADAIFLQIYYTVRNDGSGPLMISPDGIFVATKDGKNYDPDFHAGFELRMAEDYSSSLELQPGIQKSSAVSIEMPAQALKNNPQIYILRSTWAGSVPIFPDQNKESEPSAASTPTVEKSTATNTEATAEPDKPSAPSSTTPTSETTTADNQPQEPQTLPSDSSTTDQAAGQTNQSEEISRLQANLARVRESIKANSSVLEHKLNDGVTGAQLEKQAAQTLDGQEKDLVERLRKLGVEPDSPSGAPPPSP